MSKKYILTKDSISSTYSSTGTDAVNGKAINSAIETLDVADSSEDGKYVSSVSETDGIITVTRESLPTHLSGDIAVPESATENQVLTYDGTNWVAKDSSGGDPYTLPIASSETLGGIKVGDGLSIDSETGELSTTGGTFTQTQVDWEQTDSSEVDYIKNKPSSLPASDVKDWAKADTKPTYTASEVGALADTTTLSDLSDDENHRLVSDTEKSTWNNKIDKPTTAENKQVLTYDSTTSSWVAQDSQGGSSDVEKLNDLSDVDAESPAENQVLTYDGTNWIAANAQSGAVYTAGDGIDISSSNVVSTETRLIDITKSEYESLSEDEQNDPTIYYNITDANPDKIYNCVAVKYNTDTFFVSDESKISRLLNDDLVYKASSGNYIYISKPFRPKELSWSITLCFKANSISSTNTLLGVFHDSAKKLPVIIEFQVVDGKNLINVYIASASNTWSVVLSGATNIEVNKQYWVRLQYNDGVYSLLLSEDGNTYNTEATISSEIVIVDSADSLFYLGSCYDGMSGFYFDGYLYLNECNIKINNSLWWGINKVVYGLPFAFGIDVDGNYGYYKDGADTVTPFKSGLSFKTDLSKIRYVKWIIMCVKSSQNGTAQFKQFRFVDSDGNIFTAPTDRVVTSNLEKGSFSEDQDPKYWFDNTDNTIGTSNFGSDKWWALTVDLLTECLDLTSYSKYQWYTGSDTERYTFRHPSVWFLQVSNDGTTWATVDIVSNNTIEARNNALAYEKEITEIIYEKEDE